MKKLELHSEIDIEAPAEQIWLWLTNFAGFKQWNPLIREASGETKLGAKLELFIKPPNTDGLAFCAKIDRLEQNRALSWQQRLTIPGLFDGKHSFTLDALAANQTRFSQHEVISGLLVPLFGKDFEANIRHGFEAMNQALKAQVEKQQSRLL